MGISFNEIIKLPFVRNTLKLSSSSAFMMLLPLVVTPILSRLYTPEDYGSWGVFSSVLYIVNSFLFLSYENTIVKSNNNKEIPSLIGLCALVAASIILIVGIVFFVGRIAQVKFFVEFPCLPLLLVLLVITSVQTICNNMANRENLYGKMAYAGIINGVSQASFRILLGIVPIVAYGLIVGNVLAQVISTLYVLYYLSIIFKGGFLQGVTWKEIKGLARIYKKFPLFDAPARLIEFSIGNLTLIILTYFWSKDQLGCYSMIVQFILIPIAVIGSAMANVYYREISENIDSKEALVISTRRAARITFSISLLPLLFLALGGDKLLVLFLGEQWRTAGTMALCMVIYSVPVVLSEPLLPIFRTLDKQEQRFKLNALCLVLSIGGLVTVSMLTNNIYLSLIVYSTLYAFVRFLMYFRVLKLAGLRVRDISSIFIFAILISYVILAIRLYIQLK